MVNQKDHADKRKDYTTEVTEGSESIEGIKYSIGNCNKSTGIG